MVERKEEKWYSPFPVSWSLGFSRCTCIFTPATTFYSPTTFTLKWLLQVVEFASIHDAETNLVQRFGSTTRSPKIEPEDGDPFPR